MIDNTFPGLFIAFEGLDGSGENTQAQLLAGILEKQGYRVKSTSEPTNSLIGGVIKARLSGEWHSTDECLQLLFASDRAHHLASEIIPHLSTGHIVISDRYVFSSVAYGSLNIKDTEWIKKINSAFIAPDITFLMKVRPKICSLRTKEFGHGLELFTDEKKLIKVWGAYEELASKHKNIHVIDGERDEIEITKEIFSITNKVLKSIESKKS